MATALLSLPKATPTKGEMAMTGELTLTGKVLPVGGIQEKGIAAKRAGINELILPKDNERDFDEMPDDLKQDVTTHFVSEFAEVAALCF
jgi:ATP-dependent Lon protease